MSGQHCGRSTQPGDGCCFGFSLIELLIVLVIVSVLAAMLLPSLEQGLERSRRLQCMNNQRQLVVASTAYAADFNDCLPSNNFGADDADGYQLCRIGTTATNSWAMVYCQIPLYTNALPSGVPSDNPVTGDSFPSGDRRGILMCPSSQLFSCAASLRDQESDYFLSGLGGAGFYTRLSSVARMETGVPKAMFFDNLFPVPTARPFKFESASCHRPGMPEGLNVVAADGSGRWRDHGQFGPINSAQAFYFAYPYGYLSQMQRTYRSWWAPPQYTFHYATATGMIAYYRTDINPVEYVQAVRMWY